MWQFVIDCPFLCHARVFASCIDGLHDFYRLKIHFMPSVVSVGPCRRYLLPVAFCADTVLRLCAGLRVFYHREAL